MDRARPTATSPARRWRCCGDLADLAAVPDAVRRRRAHAVAARLRLAGRHRATRWPNSPGAARDVFDHLTGTDTALFYAGIAVLAVVPPLIGAFWGAPVVARELETGTYRLVWNQSVTRSTWLAAKPGSRAW